MKKKASIILLLIIAISFVNSHSLGRFLIEEPFKRGSIGTAYVTIRNNFNTKLEDVNVKFYIYDLGLMFSSVPNDVSKNDHITQRVFMPIPRNVRPGNYLTKITVGNDHYEDNQHIYLRIV